MPLTGRNNLAETPLLQYLGDQRWRHVSDLIGIPSRDIVDEAGERLYATFFYVEIEFPEAGRCRRSVRTTGSP
jgi:probable biosynthetic protein (TIGR04098 family)